MKISFKKNVFENLNSLTEISKYLNLKNREIKIDVLTPLEAENIDTLIRFWNIEDEELKKNFAEREPIKIYINSLGGSLEAALSIVDAISISRTPVYTFNIGSVQKESFLIYLAGTKRLAYENSTFMYSTSILSSEEMEDNSFYYAKEKIIKSRIDKVKNMFLSKTNMSESQYEKYDKKELWFTAEEAIKIHLCNDISRRHFHFVKQKD